MDANSYWYLDSASATHICYQKDCFDLLQEVVVGNLTLGNKSIVKVMGIGVVKIKMFDGVVRSLGGVAYVPKMRKNLISLSLLDSKGSDITLFFNVKGNNQQMADSEEGGQTGPVDMLESNGEHSPIIERSASQTTSENKFVSIAACPQDRMEAYIENPPNLESASS
ncbi:Uncharacterized protein TCM_043452 [Theobroma cacao]|uniref:Retrovirus-related Pol polyprotein from transposon TNT 1-94-like beta-barrel domain-containing protein n=1 Tax=Theobroma cacao TaxID=3641 RepID=A0A061FVU0_THECC|nr:Uncharacterized protein TCM_043452 [Theobroma cacao]